MKRLYLLRHAKSDWTDPTLHDHDRPLAKRGRKAAPLIGAYMNAERLDPMAILCSTARRAVDTLSIVHETGKLSGVIAYERSLYMATPERLLERIHSMADTIDSIMLVGHNPGLEELASEIAGPESDGTAAEALGEKYPTAALAIYELPFASWTGLETRTGRLVAFLTPKRLAAEEKQKRAVA